MKVESTLDVCRERYPFGKGVHKVLCRIFGESKVFQYDLAFEDEFKVEISGTYIPGDPGNPSRDPDKYDSPTDEELEDLKATLNSETFQLTKDEEKKAEEILLEKGHNQYKEYCFEPPW